MTQDITKEEAERRLREAGVDPAITVSKTHLGDFWFQSDAMDYGVWSSFCDGLAALPKPRRWTEAEVRREFERDMQSTDEPPGTSIYLSMEAQLRSWYGMPSDVHFSGPFAAAYGRPETRNCALGVVGYSVEKPNNLVQTSHGLVEWPPPPSAPRSRPIVDTMVIDHVDGRRTQTEYVNGDLKQAQRDCIYVPRAYEVLRELYSACVLNTLDENHLRQAAAIIARHLGEPVPDARQKVFTLHTKQLESGEWECRVQTIDKWMAAVVTGRTREEAEAAGEKIGAVL